MLTEKDLKFIARKRISPVQVKQQIEQFQKGTPLLEIVKPVTHKDGIKQLTEKKLQDYIQLYEKEGKKLTKIKFVPASGAATRMFRELYGILNTYKGTEEDYLRVMADNSFNSANYLCKHLKSFAFYSDLEAVLEKNGTSLDEISKKKDLPTLLQFLLTEKGLNYGNLPKGLLKFHRTETTDRTPLEEHIIEGMEYAATKNKVNLHFTVSENHLPLFKELAAKLSASYYKQTKYKLNIAFSVQKPETDTLTVDGNNQPLRDADGNLIFRPGGHGALIYNLNDLKEDIIFIKNIDNVVQERLKQDTILYKKALAGVLLEVRSEASYHYKKLKGRVNDIILKDAEDFITKKLHISLPEESDLWEKDQKVPYFLAILDRPYRVCGMVRNEGDLGGGPYWVRNADGSLSLQIVEGSQFTTEQKVLMQKSTHFNPVDLVCYIKNFKGKKYDLTKYIDRNTCFISSKSLDGNEIKALELPGLWNGSMALWNTAFVEVPVTTFNPVKTINDLLRAEHLYEKDLLANSPEYKVL